MAGTVTVNSEVILKTVQKVKYTWISDTAGNADGVSTENHYTGEVVRLITNPGTAAPTDNYDIVVNDDDGYDVLIGGGANRDTSNTEQVVPSSSVLGAMTNSKLTLGVSNAGDTKSGVVILYIR